MQIISSSQSVKLLNFDTLETVIEQTPIRDFARSAQIDVQFHCNKLLYCCYGGGDAFHFLRIKNAPNKTELLPVKKFRIHDSSCFACPKTSSRPTFLVGSSNGIIKQFNMQDNAENIIFQHPGNCVNSLEYSYCDDYFCSLHENGKLHLFGLKTSKKLNTFDCAKHFPLIARFHPTRKLRLAVGGNTGNVTFWDLQAKKPLYSNSDAQEHPVRDLCMPVSEPNWLLSVGYDSTINFFDIRQKKFAFKISQQFGINSIDASECGHYICTGDLRGNVDCYDLRKISVLLNHKKVHDNQILRVAFVPATGAAKMSESDSSGIYHCSLSEQIENVSVKAADKRDSLFSLMAEAAERREQDYSPKTRMSVNNRFSTESRMSLLSHRHRFDDLLNSIDYEDVVKSPQDSSTNNTGFDHNVNTQRLRERDSRRMSATVKDVPYHGIPSRKSTLKDLHSRDTVLKPVLENAYEEKENTDQSILEEKHDSCTAIFQDLASKNNSTPNVSTKTSPSALKSSEEYEALNEKIDRLAKDQMDLIKSELNLIKWNAEQSNFQNYSQSFKFFYRQEQEMEDIRNSVRLVANFSIGISEDYNQLKMENEALKRELQMYRSS